MAKKTLWFAVDGYGYCWMYREKPKWNGKTNKWVVEERHGLVSLGPDSDECDIPEAIGADVHFSKTLHRVEFTPECESDTDEAVTCSFGKEPCAPAPDSWVLTDGNLRIEIPFGHPEIANLILNLAGKG